MAYHGIKAGNRNRLTGPYTEPQTSDMTELILPIISDRMCLKIVKAKDWKQDGFIPIDAGLN
ncbi:1542_t:CDS:2 [Paraglomus brasilianum]|uniref:1542_t:CDS:1 n=1 Tax=Paraglomus brasilianum TaxID=144538 RepID=A0A9N9F1X4_9GLOM|nr:1542_t:CDS:2 [Paraglomus brasilianum]